MHKIYWSIAICKSKCDIGFDWPTLPLTAVIFEALAKGLHCQYHIFLVWPQSSCTLEEKKLANAWRGGVSMRGKVMIFWLLQYFYDKHIHLHEIDKGGFYLFIAFLSTTSNHLEKLKCFNRCAAACCFKLSWASSFNLSRNINVSFPPPPPPPSNCLIPLPPPFSPI